MDIDELPLGTRAYGVLKKAGVDTVEDLCLFTAEQLLHLGNFGQKSLDEVEQALQERSLCLHTRVGRSAACPFVCPRWLAVQSRIQRFEPGPRELGRVYGPGAGQDSGLLAGGRLAIKRTAAQAAVDHQRPCWDAPISSRNDSRARPGAVEG